VDDPAVPSDKTNLVYKAASLLFKSIGINPGIKIDLKKKFHPEQALAAEAAMLQLHLPA